MEVINELVRIKYPLNEPKVNGITALGISAIHGKLQIMKKLVENGADVNLTSPAGISPLYLAIKARNIDCIRYLYEKGAKSYYNDQI
jgi:ankyrin repeat protein